MGLLLPRRRLPLLLAVLVTASHGVPSCGDGDGVGYDASMCVREPYNCGGVSISYPFYSRTGALLGNSSSYCGYPGLEIQCEDGQAFLELESGNYTVRRIDYKDLTVQLVDPEVLDGRSCPRTDHNVTLRSFEWLYYPNTTVDLLFFFNCNFLSSGLLSRPSDSNATACRFDVGQPIGLSFVFLEQDVPFRDSNWWQRCGLVIEVPVLNFALPPDPRNDPTWKDGGYGRSLSEGFQLALNQSGKTQACDQRERTDGQCGHNQTWGFVACLCSGGHVSAAHNCTVDSSDPSTTDKEIHKATPKILSLLPIEQLLGASRVNGGGDAPLSQRAMAGLRLGGSLAVDDWGDGRCRGDGSTERREAAAAANGMWWRFGEILGQPQRRR